SHRLTRMRRHPVTLCIRLGIVVVRTNAAVTELGVAATTRIAGTVPTMANAIRDGNAFNLAVKELSSVMAFPAVCRLSRLRTFGAQSSCCRLSGSVKGGQLTLTDSPRNSLERPARALR